MMYVVAELMAPYNCDQSENHNGGLAADVCESDQAILDQHGMALAES